MSAPVILALVAWGCLDLGLLTALAGLAVADGDPSSRLGFGTAVLAVFFGVNAYALDSLGRHFGV